MRRRALAAHEYDRAMTGCKHWAASEGLPTPLGATWIPSEGSFNFAIYSKYADDVTVLLYGADEYTVPMLEYQFDPFTNKTGRIWHARISANLLKGATYYAYSIGGPPATGERFERHAFNRQKVLLDPYATSVFFPPEFARSTAVGSQNNAGKAPLGVLENAVRGTFDWGNDIKPDHDSDLIIYELHVRGFTMNPNSGVSAENRGTFAGVVEKIPYLRDLGVTAVELMPVFQFDASEPNYWGYMPLNFFSPHDRYARDQAPGSQRREFQNMVKALHDAEIEVILDVVYNHTGEANESGPVYSFKGIDNSTYYIASDDPLHPYADFTGTGNTLHCANRAVRQLIVDSLTYWATEMHVDGFRFDLASVFSRNSDGSINFSDPPIFGDIAANHHLGLLRLIAEPWEGNTRFLNYQLGTDVRASGSTTSASALQRNFPGTGWRQWNDKFRTTVRRVVKGEPGTVPDLMTRLYGSADVFPDSVREAYRPWQSLNYVSSHDGLTLYDLVSYDTPEGWNCGGPDGEIDVSAEVSSLRKRQVKNFCCLLFLANGTPMFRAGDEFLQTQQGCDNPYNVDSEQSWLDWSRKEENGDILRFFKEMIAFRKAHRSLGRSHFWREDISWYGVGPHVDLSQGSRSLAYGLRGSSEGDDDLYVMINASDQSLEFVIQEQSPNGWRRMIDTSLEGPNDIVGVEESLPLASLNVEVRSRSIVVCLSCCDASDRSATK
jgi:isoamylase